MELRKSERRDLDDILQIILQAQAFLRELGVDQWQNGYPNDEVILEDIARGESYVLTDGGTVAATAVLSFETEPTYAVVYGGAWQCEGTSAVIHRIATNAALRGRGVARTLLDGLEELCRKAGADCVRVDTHVKNLPMQSRLTGRGYRRCGEIVLTDGVSRREAFEKPLA